MGNHFLCWQLPPINIHTKVRLFRDAFGTFQFIVEAILIYNPIKIFLVLSFASLFLSMVLIFSGFGIDFYDLVFWGIGGFFISAIIFFLGLLDSQTSRILNKNK